MSFENNCIDYTDPCITSADAYVGLTRAQSILSQETEEQCENWSTTDFAGNPSVNQPNICSNPNGFANGPWCYKANSAIQSPCFADCNSNIIPGCAGQLNSTADPSVCVDWNHPCAASADAYTAITKAVTKSGIPCVNWDDVTDHDWLKLPFVKHPNVCSNHMAWWPEGPWCYTDTSSGSWENCFHKCDFCRSLPCHYLAACVPNAKGFECICPRGFTNSLCTNDTNECIPNPCPVDTVCMDSINGHTCITLTEINAAENNIRKFVNEEHNSMENSEIQSFTNPRVMFTAMQDATSYMLSDVSEELRLLTGHGLNQTVLDCAFSRYNDCEWTEILHSRYGLCHSFNSYKSRTTNVPGHIDGLRLSLDAAPEDYATFVHTVGFKIAFHAPDIHPFLEYEGSNVLPDYENYFVIQQSRINLLKQPYGDCVHATNRSAYYYPGNYSVFGCQLSVQQDHFVKECGCINPLYGNLNRSISSCNLEKHGCIRKAEAGHSVDFGQACKPACRRDLYSVLEYKTKKRIDPTISWRSNKKGITTVSAYFNTLMWIRTIERPLYTIVDLIGDFGGLLGLTAGMSVVSLIELTMLFYSILVESTKKLSRRNLKVKRSEYKIMKF